MVLQSTSPRPMPHVHGVEDSMGSRFWALGEESESDSEVESVESIDTPDFIKQAQDVGFTVPQLIAAEKELHDNTGKSPLKEGLANKIVNSMVRHKTAGRPWRGKLPAPRVSPVRTFGDALASAKVCKKSSSPVDVSPFLNSASSPRRPLLLVPEMVQIARSDLVSNLGQESRKSTSSNSERNQMRNKNCNVGRSPVMGRKKMCLIPSVPYRPTQSLVALFSWTGTMCCDPRAPHSAVFHNPATSYVEVARSAMEGGGANQGVRGGAANRGAGRTNGQAGMLGRGGFQPANFHPGSGSEYGGRGKRRYNGANGYLGGRSGGGNNRGGHGVGGRNVHSGRINNHPGRQGLVDATTHVGHIQSDAGGTNTAPAEYVAQAGMLLQQAFAANQGAALPDQGQPPVASAHLATLLQQALLHFKEEVHCRLNISHLNLLWKGINPETGMRMLMLSQKHNRAWTSQNHHWLQGKEVANCHTVTVAIPRDTS